MTQCTPPPELPTTVGRIMRRAAASWHTDEDWPLLAMLVLGVPEVWASLRYRQRALTRHVPRPRVPGSVDTVCGCCLTGWPCLDAVELGLG